jgi:hypothetical protein
MGIEIVSLSEKGMALSHSVRRSPDRGWDVIYFIARLGGSATLDKVSSFVFNGDTAICNAKLRELRHKGIIV